MAGIFLSYDRDDGAKARQIALALEKAGHSVWWDLHVRGGAQFSKVIEEALKAADAIVVLWSRESVESSWVRDEAAVGRDSGRLVPVSLDETEPPLGFRQFQTIDLSGWKGRGPPPRLQYMLAAIDGSACQPERPANRAAPRIPVLPGMSRAARLGLITALVFATVALAYFLVNRGETSSVPVVAVAAADNSRAARSLADDLFIKLGSLQAAKADALQLVEQDSDSSPDLRFRVGQRTERGQTRATVALLAGDSGGLLWAREFELDKGPEADLRQQVAYSAAQALSCASEGLSPAHDKLEIATLKLYLNGCASVSDESVNTRSLIDIFRKITEQAPDFEGGWAKLLLAETGAFTESNLRDPVLRKNMRAHINQARKLNPTMAEAYIAEAWLQPLRPISGFIRFTEEAVRKNPNHANALYNHSEDMFHVGRVQQAVYDMRQAVRSDPLSPGLRRSLINGLANAGEFEAAMIALREAERLWPGTSGVIDIRFELMLRYGEPREALKILRSGAKSRQFVSPAVESFLEARIDPTPAKVAKAIEEARAVSTRWPANYLQTLAEFGRKDELVEVLLEMDPEQFTATAVLYRPDFSILHNDPRFMAIAKRWGLLNYWRTSGNWPDFCFKPALPYDCKAEAAKLS